MSSMWLVFFAVIPQLRKTYELRLRYLDREAWDCLIYMDDLLCASFSGNGETTANELWGRVFEAIGAGDVAVPAGD